jgi:hypothetical protein
VHHTLQWRGGQVSQVPDTSPFYAPIGVPPVTAPRVSTIDSATFICFLVREKGRTAVGLRTAVQFAPGKKISKTD